jgi:hypothetical protein
MASNSKGLFVEQNKQALLEKLTDSYPSTRNIGAVDDSTGTR